MNLLGAGEFWGTPASFFWLGLLIFLLLLFPGNLLRIRYRKRSVSNSDMERILDHYLQIRQPDYAIMISGKWGIGKTYFIRSYLRRIQWNIFREFPVFVSLYGVENEEQIEQELVKKTLLSWRTIFSLLLLLIPLYFLKPLFPDLLGIVKRIGGENKIEFWGFVGPILVVLVAYLYKTFKLNWLNLLLWKRPIIFDDFERTKMNGSEMLAYLNRYVEHLHKHIVIVCNEEELNRNDENFRKIREKVIGKQLSFSPDSEMAMKNLLNTKQFPLLCGLLDKQFSWKWFQLVTTPKNENVNLRVWIFCCREFEALFRGVNRELLHNKKVWVNFVPQFFALKYSLQIHNFGNGRILDQSNSKGIFKFLHGNTAPKWFRELFPHIDEMIDALPESEWDAIIDNGLPDVKMVDEYWVFLIHGNPELWARLSYYYKQTDEENLKIWQELIDAYRHKTINDPAQILSIFGIVLEMISRHCCPWQGLTAGTALQLARKYIRKLTTFAEMCEHSYDLTRHTYQFYQGCCTDSQEFQEINQELIDAIKKFEYKSIAKTYEQFLTLLHADDREFNQKWYRRGMVYQNIFSGQDPQKLLAELLSLPPEMLWDRENAIRSYLKDSSSLRYQAGDFWEKFAELIQTCLTKDLPHIDCSKQALLRELNETVIEVAKQYKKLLQEKETSNKKDAKI